MNDTARPTDAAWPADNAPSRRWPIYTRGNVGEVFPDVVLPLEWDLAGQASEDGWRQGAKAVGFLVDSDFEPDEPMTVIGVFNGYAYFNASIMRLLGVRTPGMSVDLIDTQFLGEAAVDPYIARPGDVNRRASLNMVKTALTTLTTKSVPLLDEMRQRVDRQIAIAPPLDAESATLWQFLCQSFGELTEFLIGSHVINTMRATIAAGALTDLCEKKLGDPNLAVTLTTGLGDVRSAQPAAEMWVLANETPPDAFDDAFAGFLQRHGHRGPNEFSLGGRDWAAYPEIARAAIDNMRGADPERSPARQLDRMQAERAAAVADARARMGWQARRLDSALRAVTLWSRAREESKDEIIRLTQPGRHRYLELVRRAAELGGDPDPAGPLMLTAEEFEDYLVAPSAHLDTIADRRARHEHLRSLEPPFAFSGRPPELSTWTPRATTGVSATAGSVLQGAAGAPGVARGRARLVKDPSDPTALGPGDILIAPLTDPSWTPLFVPAEGVVVEVGAAMSHSMIVSRELGIPCVVGVADAMLSIPDGAMIEIDGQAGTVTIVSVAWDRHG